MHSRVGSQEPLIYVQNEVDKALSLFQQCVHVSQGQNKAAALNMLGCCCAVKVSNQFYFNIKQNYKII